MPEAEVTHRAARCPSHREEQLRRGEIAAFFGCRSRQAQSEWLSSVWPGGNSLVNFKPMSQLARLNRDSLYQARAAVRRTGQFSEQRFGFSHALR